MSHPQPKQGHTPAPEPKQGWVQWTDTGKMSMSKKEKNVFIFEGVNQRGFSACEFRGSDDEKAILESRNWLLLCEMKVAPCDFCPKQELSVILDVVAASVLSSSCDFVAIRANMVTHEIRVENYAKNASGVTLFSCPNLSSLRANNYYTLRIEGCPDGLKSLSLNGVTLVQNLPFNRASKSMGAIGIACYGKTRSMMRRFKIEAPTEKNINNPIPPAVTAANPSASSLVPYVPPGMPGMPQSTYERSVNDDLDLMAVIERDIVVDDLNVSLDDIGGLASAKRALNEAVVLPLLMPDIFTGIRAPWRGVLLFGPPGTGKTMLAKAVASVALDSHITFFNCSVATLTSKWRGESEKLLRALFASARTRSGSILFFDEVDSLLSQRGSHAEHEASRRFKSEFLIYMDGLLSDKNNNAAGDKTTTPFVLCTSNAPWDIDEALRRRLEKRVYIPLPDTETRAHIIEKIMRGMDVAEDCDGASIAQLTEGYSGSDLQLVMREAAMAGVRVLLEGLTPAEVVERRNSNALTPPKVTMTDLVDAVSAVQPSVSQVDVARFEAWAAEFGSA
eukprot:GEMP01025334.1.p1 GENE.GEMP01025334.1~~GEMP01025334.1.p1  ORF type:complete len:562 (+),score=152.08 GEMP01025334.1:90-1775(+)